MTAFYKIVDSGYISGIGTNGSDSVTAITESEYADILSAIRNRPTAPDGFEYKLKADLTWERVPIEPEPLTDEEALTRFSNTITGANDPDLISAAETLITDRIKEDSK